MHFSILCLLRMIPIGKCDETCVHRLEYKGRPKNRQTRIMNPAKNSKRGSDAMQSSRGRQASVFEGLNQFAPEATAHLTSGKSPQRGPVAEHRSLGVSAAALSLRLSQDSALCRQSHTCSALSQRMSTVRLPKETTTTFGVQHASQVPV